MPTSKDLLDAAKKVLKDNSPSEMNLATILKTGTDDVAAYAKAKAELRTSMTSMKGETKNLSDDIKNLTSGLSALQKVQPVMKAPADAKVYAEIVRDMTDKIKVLTKYAHDIDERVKTGERLKTSP